MSGKPVKTVVFCLLVCLHGAQINDFGSRVAGKCSGVNLTALLPSSDAARAAEVAKYSNPYSVSLQDLIRMTYNGLDTSYFEGVSVFALAMVILMIVFSAAALIVFVLFLRFCESCSFRKSVARKALFFAALVFAVAIVALSIALWALAGKASRSLNDVSCAAAIIPDSTINGMSKSGIAFAGLSSMATTLTALSGDLPSLNYLGPQLILANKTSWNADADLATSSLPVFFNIQSQVKIQNGNGADATPSTVSAINRNITDGIGAQVHFLGQTLKYLNDSVAVSSYYTAVGTNKVTAAINLVASNLRSLGTSITESSNNYLERFDLFVGVGQKGSVAAIVILCFLFVAVLAQMVFLFFFQFTGKCFGRRVVSKAILICSGVLGLLLAIFSLFVLLNAFASGSVCRGIGTLLELPSFQQFVDAHGLKVGSVSATTGVNGVIALFDNCAISGASGNMGAIFEGSQTGASTFTDLIKLVNGFKHFSQNREALRSPVTSSSSITALSASLDPVRSGASLDFPTVAPALATFNGLVACSGVVYAFNSGSCAGTCTLITASSIYANFDCVADKTDAQKRYTNLQKYIAQEIAMVDRFREDLGVAASSPTYSPAKLFNTGFADVTSNAGTLDLAAFAMAKTTATVSGIKEDYMTSTNCLVFRKQIQMLQGAYCLEGNQNNAAFFVVIIVTVSIVLVFNCITYFSLRCSGESVIDAIEPDSPVKSNKVASDKDLAKSNQVASDKDLAKSNEVASEKDLAKSDEVVNDKDQAKSEEVANEKDLSK